MGRDFFGTARGRCTAQGCACPEFIALADQLSEGEKRALPDFMSCQRRSELTLTCGCGHWAAEHASPARRQGGEASADQQGAVTAAAAAAPPEPHPDARG